MRNLRLLLEYDGTGYAGWQLQDNAPTLQGALEGALGVLLKSPVRVTASGRTDAGVHALGQVANFRTEAGIPLKGVVCGLNSLLPPDISVRRADSVPLDFDSCRSAREKTYQYFVHRGATPSVFARRTSWWVWGPFDVEAARQAASCLLGTHDFGAFRAAGCDAAHSERTLHELSLTPRGEFLEFRARGSGFLRHMVRILVGTLVDVAQGRRPATWVADVLGSRDRGRAGPTAPAQGLFLSEVRYDVGPLESYP